MGRLYYRTVRYVDSRIKSDGKLLKFVKLHPAIYDKNHKGYRNKQEREKIWKYISSCLGISGMYKKYFCPSNNLIREYKYKNNFFFK